MNKIEIKEGKTFFIGKDEYIVKGSDLGNDVWCFGVKGRIKISKKQIKKYIKERKANRPRWIAVADRVYKKGDMQMSIVGRKIIIAKDKFVMPELRTWTDGLLEADSVEPSKEIYATILVHKRQRRYED